MMVRGPTMVTSSPRVAEAAAEVLGGELGAAVVLLGRGARLLGDGVASGAPKTALDEVWTTFLTLAARDASSRLTVPPSLTVRKASRSLASGTCATL
jgi:hypothetical protein